MKTTYRWYFDVRLEEGNAYFAAREDDHPELAFGPFRSGRQARYEMARLSTKFGGPLWDGVAQLWYRGPYRNPGPDGGERERADAKWVPQWVTR
jgi:hypothetical protein